MMRLLMPVAFLCIALATNTAKADLFEEHKQMLIQAIADDNSSRIRRLLSTPYVDATEIVDVDGRSMSYIEIAADECRSVALKELLAETGDEFLDVYYYDNRSRNDVNIGKSALRKAVYWRNWVDCRSAVDLLIRAGVDFYASEIFVSQHERSSQPLLVYMAETCGNANTDSILDVVFRFERPDFSHLDLHIQRHYEDLTNAYPNRVRSELGRTVIHELGYELSRGIGLHPMCFTFLEMLLDERNFGSGSQEQRLQARREFLAAENGLGLTALDLALARCGSDILNHDPVASRARFSDLLIASGSEQAKPVSREMCQRIYGFGS